MMHARKRVSHEYTEEEIKKRRKLMTKVLKMNKLFIQIRNNPKKCKDPLKFTALMIQDVNGDHPTCYNFRRELILEKLEKLGGEAAEE